MHPNPIFRPDARDRNLAFARERGFGLLVASGGAALLAAHVPFLLSPAADRIDLHLVRSNPLARALIGGPLAALMAVSGPDAYLSPDWYGIPDQVPTWNYVAVHLRGPIELRPQDEMPALLAAQSAASEAGLAPKPPWTMAKMKGGVAERMMRQIVPCRLTIEAVDGTWKLSQNKPAEVRLRASEALAARGRDDLARLMRETG